MHRQYLFASDFDKTLSFLDSGALLAQQLGIHDFDRRVAALGQKNLVQQGGELAYLLLHDPDFAGVRRADLEAAGRGVEVKANVGRLVRLLEQGCQTKAGRAGFHFYVVSAAPQEVVEAALHGLVPKDRIVGTTFRFDGAGRIVGLDQVPAGYGKVVALQRLQRELDVADDRIIYAGDGESDIHVMLHVNERAGYTIAVSRTEQVARIARRTVLSDDATAVLVPILEDLGGFDAAQVRQFFRAENVMIQGWAKMRTDVVTIRC